MKESSIEEIRKNLKKYHQEHLWDFYEKLEGKNKEKFLEQLKNIDYGLIDSLYKNTKKEFNQENAKIEQDITTIVKDYMNYEKDTYKIASEQIDGSSLLVLTELYPDLKSNELIKKQIEIYTENNNKIKQLKEEKINNQTCKWWLYFGSIEESEEE